MSNIIFVSKLPIVLALVLMFGFVTPAQTEPENQNTRHVSGELDDVMFALKDAIINRGFVVDYTGNVGGMLERTSGALDRVSPL